MRLATAERAAEVVTAATAAGANTEGARLTVRLAAAEGTVKAAAATNVVSWRSQVGPGSLLLVVDLLAEASSRMSGTNTAKSPASPVDAACVWV